MIVSSTPVSATSSAEPLAAVVDLEQVAALGRDQLEQLHELARAVGHTRAEHEVAPGTRQPVADDRDEQRGVDVPAGEERAHVAPAGRAVQQRRDRRRAGAFDDELRRARAGA